MPKIKFNGLEEAQRGNYKGYKITGTKEDGAAWDTFVFAETTTNGKKGMNPIITTLKGAPIGSDVNIVMEKNGKFWNAKDAVIMAAGDGNAVPATSTAKPQTGGYAKKSTGNFRSPDATDRASAIHLSHDVVKTLIAAGCLGKAPKEDLILTKVDELASKYFAYIHDGVESGSPAPEAETPANLQSGTEDGDPVGDDDIPF